MAGGGVQGDEIQVLTFTDGPLPGPQWLEIKRGWEKCWDDNYGSLGDLEFLESRNLKEKEVFAALPARSREAVGVRNPDLLFVASPGEIELGGLDLTVHSPDGSNIEKRYPFLWAARRKGLLGMVLTPYQKQRPSGQVNRLPHRAARRNMRLAEEWDEGDFQSSLTQILPLSSLQGGLKSVPSPVRSALWSWEDVGELFGHRLALAVAGGSAVSKCAKRNLAEAKRRLCALHLACQNATKNTSASTLFVGSDRVVQTYNARPESGHWERGEGQFDSIDGRLMVTMDDLELFQPKLAKLPLEFWLPQMARGHVWIKEQELRGFQSKRLRNILVTLKGLVTTKFADELSERDWELLRKNPRLCLERDDRWVGDLYWIVDAFAPADRATIASTGLAHCSVALKAEIEAVLKDRKLFYGSFRGYENDWRTRLEAKAARLPSGSKLLLPRIPKAAAPRLPAAVAAKFAEDCSKAELMALRQLHRSSLAKVKAY
jgi:hypothetical protein